MLSRVSTDLNTSRLSKFQQVGIAVEFDSRASQNVARILAGDLPQRTALGEVMVELRMR